MKFIKELKIAEKAARKAGRIQLQGLTAQKKITIKDDASPVTEIDRQCEAAIRTIIKRQFPEDGFLGEEEGASKGSSGRTWIIDPIDGTRPYIRGIPTFSALIALEENGIPVVGVMHLPALGETYTGSAEAKAALNGKEIRVSGTTRVEESMGAILDRVGRGEKAAGPSLTRIHETIDYCYGFMDGYSYGLVASGRHEFVINLFDKAWDCAAAACIVKAAGGQYSDIHGNETIHNGNIIISNGHLHEGLLSIIKASQRE